MTIRIYSPGEDAAYLEARDHATPETVIRNHDPLQKGSRDHTVDCPFLIRPISEGKQLCTYPKIVADSLIELWGYLAEHPEFGVPHKCAVCLP